MSAEGQEIDVHILDVGFDMRNGLGAIEDEDSPMLMGDLGEFLRRGDETQDIGDMGHRDDLGLIGDGLLKVLGG